MGLAEAAAKKVRGQDGLSRTGPPLLPKPDQTGPDQARQPRRERQRRCVPERRATDSQKWKNCPNREDAKKSKTRRAKRVIRTCMHAWCHAHFGVAGLSSLFSGVCVDSTGMLSPDRTGLFAEPQPPRRHIITWRQHPWPQPLTDSTAYEVTRLLRRSRWWSRVAVG